MARVYPPRGTRPWDDPLRMYIDSSVDEVRQAIRSILGSVEGLTNPDALQSWHEADPALQTRRVVAVGDSITEGCLASSYANTYPMRLQSALRTELGYGGGVGYVSAAPTTGAVVPALPLTRSGGTPEMWNRGIGGRAIQLKSTESVTYNAQPCTRVKVWYGRAQLSAGLKVYIDDVEVATISTNASAPGEERGGLSWESAPLTPGSHVVRVTGSNSAFAGILNGVEFMNGDETSGVRVYNAGHYGGKLVDFAGATLQMQALNALDPHLVIVYLGTNDLISSTLAQFTTALGTFLSGISASASVLLVGGYLRGDESNKPAQVTKWQQMKAAMAAQAGGRVAYFDLQPHWSNLSHTGPIDPLMVDRIHPNDTGFERLSSVLQASIQPNLLAGIIGYSGGGPASATTAAFTSAVNAINTTRKYEGKQAWNTTTKRAVWATGSAATATWVFADGTTAHTPA